MTRFRCLLLALALTNMVVIHALADVVRGEEPQRTSAVQDIPLLPPGPGNPRNSEGDYIQLKDGSILLVYTHFEGGAGDHAAAHLAGRVSRDGGQTWSEKDTVVLPNEGTNNIMSVSLLRLSNGKIGLFYLRKNSLEDCRPVIRVSDDEAKTWSDPVEMIPDAEVGYYVMNNDRVVQLTSGRLIAPLAQHHGVGWPKWTGAGRIVCYYSDDSGKTWKRGEQAPEPEDKSVALQEPGVVQLKDGRVLLFCRTNAGSQFLAHSQDDGVTWTQPSPSELLSPQSPATIERIPATGDLLIVWNNHNEISPELRGKRTPFSAAISQDDGATWKNFRTLADNPNGWYCYTAMTFVDDHVLLAHCAGDRKKNNGLAETHVTRFPVKWLYEK